MGKEGLIKSESPFRFAAWQSGNSSKRELVKSFHTGENEKQFEENFNLTLTKSSWICARCTDTDMLLNDQELEAYRGPRMRCFGTQTGSGSRIQAPYIFMPTGKKLQSAIH
jgi:hypothetical protein